MLGKLLWLASRHAESEYKKNNWLFQSLIYKVKPFYFSKSCNLILSVS